MSALRRRQLRRLIESEIKNATKPKRSLTRADLAQIINEEAENLANEGFWKGAAAAASRYLPGGGAVLDYARSQGFERIEAKLQELEARIATLEATP